jgi:hypothetical protein
MKVVILILLVLAAHFSFTPFAPAQAGQAKFYWPFAADTRAWLPIGGLPSQSGSILTPLLAGAAGLAFVAAFASLQGWLVPAEWFRVLLLAGIGASAALYTLYIGPFAILPLVMDMLFLWGLLAQNWSAAVLRG